MDDKNEIHTYHALAGPRHIKCSSCGSVGMAASFHTNFFSNNKLTHDRAIKTEAFFEGRVCKECNLFWSMALRQRKAPDEANWQFAEAQIEYFFARRNVPVARTIGRGPDIMVILFGTVLKIEVKAGWFSGMQIHAKPPTARRKKDDLAVVVLPSRKAVWLPMGDFLARVNGSNFVMDREEYETNRSHFFFEPALRKALSLRGREIGNFRLYKPTVAPFGLKAKFGTNSYAEE